ncbi:MAG: hypothetical protein ACREDT_05530 [Methylocella sp.]
MADPPSYPGTPRWVKVFGFIFIALLLLFTGLHLIGGNLVGYTFGDHGSHAPPFGATERGLQQP